MVTLRLTEVTKQLPDSYPCLLTEQADLTNKSISNGCGAAVSKHGERPDFALGCQLF